MSIGDGRGKGKTKNGSGVELFKCQPFLNHWKWAQLTMQQFLSAALYYCG